LPLGKLKSFSFTFESHHVIQVPLVHAPLHRTANITTKCNKF